MVLRVLVFGVIASSSLPCATSYAGDVASGSVDSVVVGGFAHEITSDSEGGVDANLEVRFKPLFGQDWAIDILPTIGGTVNLGGDTNTAYLGATARYDLTQSLFIEGFLGFTLHDADTPRDTDGLDLGCRLLFREGVAVGYRRGNHALSIAISHASHGDVLCDADENDGMTGIGLRYGYHF